MSKRQPFFAANWKMHKTAKETVLFFNDFLDRLHNGEGDPLAEYGIFPQAAALGSLYMAWEKGLKDRANGFHISWGVQNIHWKNEGAFTGELSPILAKELGCTYTIVGHSERRAYFAETNETAAKRAFSSYQNGMRGIFCVGETLEERDSGNVFPVLRAQCEPFFAMSSTYPDGFTLAYEPVWAIGTGKTATADQAEEVHAYLRDLLKGVWGQEAAHKVRILYGGSVKPGTELMNCPNIDGALVGGASLNPESFLLIARGRK